MDPSTLDRLADLICGDSQESPKYRTGGELTRFFANAGLSRFVHDGGTRKWWTLEVLKQCSGKELASVLRRLATPQEYGGDRAKIRSAISTLNDILYLERLKVELHGIEPKIGRLVQPITFDTEADLKPLPPPDFAALGLETGLGELLAERWTEAQRCVEATAYLAALIMMGSLLEGMLLGAIRRYPQKANQAKAAPRDTQTGQVRRLRDWTLAQMIEVGHELAWVGLDIRKFSHALREFRNLVHPHEQLGTGDRPDADTCKISWLVVQAASNDLAKVLKVK